jgi:hypothetical protein
MDFYDGFHRLLASRSMRCAAEIRCQSFGNGVPWQAKNDPVKGEILCVNDLQQSDNHQSGAAR